MSKNGSSEKLHKSLTVVGIVLCVILVPILIINCTLIVKSFINKDEVPSIGGTMPFIVLSDSMHPLIKSGDVIICKEIEAEKVEEGMVISFYDPDGSGTSVVTHKVIEKIEKDGKLSFRTEGINNNDEDRLPVPAENVIAEYTGFRVPLVGHVAMFMQTTAGLIVCVIVPIVLLVGYDIIRRRLYEKSKTDDVAALKAELEALRSMQNAEGGMQNEEEMQKAEGRMQSEEEMQNEEEMQKAECRMQNDDDDEQKSD